MKQGIKYLLFISVALFFIIQILIIKDGLFSTAKKGDVIIVLGCRLYGDKPSPTLKLRLDKAVELYNLGYGKGIIVSGGQGEDEWITEAEAMKKFLVNEGIPEEIIFEEGNSYSTYENIKFSRDIMKQKGYNKGVIVTSSYHIRRSLLIADRLGMDVSGGPAELYPNLFLKIKFYTREVIAYIKDFVMVKDK